MNGPSGKGWYGVEGKGGRKEGRGRSIIRISLTNVRDAKGGLEYCCDGWGTRDNGIRWGRTERRRRLRAWDDYCLQSTKLSANA